MKKILRIILFLIILLLLFVLYTSWSTGYFRDTNSSFANDVIVTIPLPGVEDIEIDEAASFAILSSDDRAARRDGNSVISGLFFLDLSDIHAVPEIISHSFNRPFYPHGISMMALDSNRYRILAINHFGGEHAIEVFDFQHKELKHVATLKDMNMISPNDVVIIDEESFYFTNDHGTESTLGKLAEDYLGVRCSNVVYFSGEEYAVVADHIAYANGINYDTKRQLMFVASPRDFRVKVYQRQVNGGLAFIEDIDCGTGVDNIEFDTDGNIWIGCHPSLLHFSAYAGGKKPTAPSEIIKIGYREKGNYTVESLFLDNGSTMSASTVAIPYGDKLLVGNVMDGSFVILKN